MHSRLVHKLYISCRPNIYACACLTSVQCTLVLQQINNISHGNLVMHLRCGEIFKDCHVSNIVTQMRVKEFGESANIWRSYKENFIDGYGLLLTHGVQWCLLHRCPWHCPTTRSSRVFHQKLMMRLTIYILLESNVLEGETDRQTQWHRCHSVFCALYLYNKLFVKCVDF